MTTPANPFEPPTPLGPPAYGPPPNYAPGGYGQPGYGPPPPGWGEPGHRQGPQRTDSKAIIALVLACASFILFPLIPAIVALVLASSAKRDIAASGGRLGGEGLVTAAKVISWINIGLSVLFVVILVTAFGLLTSTGFSEGGDLQHALAGRV